ncbi:DUF1543 domain-containing protein [Flavobacterium azooxidireducens]|uniref:DUF1543 domain-containing protein n=1 Tax=Flavobacterium azooxidireducens TaxID=1871076 RepID=A0ABY4KFL4_9FLAO|nr:DUF1543 domain-containing protein [Flavobacterium azooxidireducens]UPQ79591.1 DUF1543 domain-containing protein [Flavobacterium azooxidireducens]
MEENQTLFMVMLGATPPGRLTEQHDIFFGIGKDLKELIPDMKAFWPEAKDQIHIDAWRKVSFVDDFTIDVVLREENLLNSEKLFFINLGGYKENEFEEYHYKVLTVAQNKAEAIKKAKATSFYKHCGFKGATSHIDDKYGVDVDDIHEIEDILSAQFKEKFQLKITKTNSDQQDGLEIGYVKIDKLLKDEN